MLDTLEFELRLDEVDSELEGERVDVDDDGFTSSIDMGDGELRIGGLEGWMKLGAVGRGI